MSKLSEPTDSNFPRESAVPAADTEPAAGEIPEYPDWLAVSTDGFAAMNAGRDPAHLVKELVQNALDALPPEGGEVVLDSVPGTQPGTVLVTCRDSGCGIGDLGTVRTVFHTSKADSHRLRGRMGRGFKEMLCLARCASVTSGGHRILSLVEGGRRVTRVVPADRPVRGTLVQMEMPWGPDVIPRLEAYFRTLLPPRGVVLLVNGVRVQPRAAAHRVEATLPTELFEQGRWVRPARKAVIELVPVGLGEEPCVYELGIPVCPAGWERPYHANVLQRVPMNPGRDAVASGYPVKLHRACLPALLGEMSGEEVRQDWVGNAVSGCDEAVQQEVIRLGFGENLARSVPRMGARQYDEDPATWGWRWWTPARPPAGSGRSFRSTCRPRSRPWTATTGTCWRPPPPPGSGPKPWTTCPLTRRGGG